MMLSDIMVCLKHELRSKTGRVLRKALGKRTARRLPSRVPVWKIKTMIMRNGFAVASGRPSWFYTAYDRGDTDPLTNFALGYITDKFDRDSDILITGCGTGIMVFYFADQGFKSIDAFDLLPECVAVTENIKQMGGYDGVHVWKDNGFKPNLTRNYDVITALHWVFSAWMGNYGNTPADADRARTAEVRERALTELLQEYAGHLKPGGQLLIELTDAVTDYRIESDHPLGAESTNIYPIRHTPEQVQKCAAAVGLSLAEQKLCVSYGHHPRTLYALRKD